MICAYLDSIGSGPRLLPPDGAAHWQARRLETLADAILEMTVKIALEGRRPKAEQSPQWLGWWTDGLNRALDMAEAQVPDPEPLDVGKIALGVDRPLHRHAHAGPRLAHVSPQAVGLLRRSGQTSELRRHPAELSA